MAHEKARQAGADAFDDARYTQKLTFEQCFDAGLIAFLRAVEASEGMIKASYASDGTAGERWRYMADKLADELEGK